MLRIWMGKKRDRGGVGIPFYRVGILQKQKHSWFQNCPNRDLMMDVIDKAT